MGGGLSVLVGQGCQGSQGCVGCQAELGGQGGLGELEEMGELGKLGEFYEFRNFMNTWSQHHEWSHESFVNRLYECKPVKSGHVGTGRNRHIYDLLR